MKKEGPRKGEVTLNEVASNESERYLNSLMDVAISYRIPSFRVVKKTAFKPHDYFDISDSVNRNTDDE